MFVKFIIIVHIYFEIHLCYLHLFIRSLILKFSLVTMAISAVISAVTFWLLFSDQVS